MSPDHTVKRKPGRPRREGGPDPVRSFRMGDVYDRAKTKAESEGETIVAVIARKLAEYLGEDQLPS